MRGGIELRRDKKRLNGEDMVVYEVGRRSYSRSGRGLMSLTDGEKQLDEPSYICCSESVDATTVYRWPRGGMWDQSLEESPNER